MWLLLVCARFLAGSPGLAVTGSSILSRSNDPVPVETRLQLVLAVLAHEFANAQSSRWGFGVKVRAA